MINLDMIKDILLLFCSILLLMLSYKVNLLRKVQISTDLEIERIYKYLNVARDMILDISERLMYLKKGHKKRRNIKRKKK